MHFSGHILVFFQTIADIFNIPVYTIDVPNSSALGGCYRAKLGEYFHISIKWFLQCLITGIKCLPFFTLVNVYVDLLVFTRIAGTT